MSKYPEEIVKAAEELIEKHTRDPLFHRNWLDDEVIKRRLIPAIKAALVSCEFAMKSAREREWNELVTVKFYLEELL